MNSRVPLILTLVFLGLFVSHGPFNIAHGSAAGLICLADPTSAAINPANPCPRQSGPVFNGPVTNPGQQIRIGVFVSGSGGLTGFDITLLTDHAVLRPAGVDLSGTVLLGTPVVLVECLSGVLVKGSICLGADTVDTLHFASISGVGSGPTVAPTTGLLFTAIYNITGTTTGTIPLGYLTGCNGTSVTGGVCITVVDGSQTPVVEMAQGGSFDNSVASSSVSLTVNQSSFGPEFPNTPNTVTVNVTAINGYPGFATDSVTVTTVASAGLTANLSGTNPCSTSGTFCSLSLLLSASVGGNYSVSVLARYSTVDLRNFNSSTLVAHATVQVVATDFAISADPAIVSPILAGVAVSSLVTVTSVNGFTGIVALSVAAPAYQCSLSPGSVVLPGSSSSMLRCSSPSAGNFAVTVTARSGVASHTVQVGFSVQDFSVSVNPSSISLLAGSNESIFLTVSGVNGFARPVTVSIAPVNGLTVDPSSAVFSPLGLLNVLIIGGSVGDYNLTITLSSSTTLSHSLFVHVRVTSVIVNGSSNLFGVTPVLFYSLLAILGGVVILSIVLGVRWRLQSNVRRGLKNRSL